VAHALENVAVTLRAIDMVSVHAPVPRQGPAHPANVEHADGAAVSVTRSPLGSGAAQRAALPDAHAIPGPVTAPGSGLPRVTPPREVGGWDATVTVRAVLTSTPHVLPLEEVQPIQLFTMAPGSGDAVSVIVAPLGASALQVPAASVAHSTPGPVTCPVAPPELVGLTVSL
jgi:hypothetical protein